VAGPRVFDVGKRTHAGFGGRGAWESGRCWSRARHSLPARFSDPRCRGGWRSSRCRACVGGRSGLSRSVWRWASCVGPRGIHRPRSRSPRNSRVGWSRRTWFESRKVWWPCGCAAFPSTAAIARASSGAFTSLPASSIRAAATGAPNWRRAGSPSKAARKRSMSWNAARASGAGSTACAAASQSAPLRSALLRRAPPWSRPLPSATAADCRVRPRTSSRRAAWCICSPARGCIWRWSRWWSGSWRGAPGCGRPGRRG
jgi:hypothetical protein